MNEIVYQWGRLAWWVYHANPEVVATVLATVVSVGVTAILALLTYYNVKATARQARAMLQPALKVETTFYNDPKHPKYDASGVAPGTSETGIGSLSLVNLGDHPVVLLDVTGSAHPFGRPAVVKQFGWLDEQILYPGENYHIVVHFDFTKELSEAIRKTLGAGYEFRVVASDLSREIAVTYVLQPVLERRTHRLGVPWGVRLKYRKLDVTRVYYRFKYDVMLRFNRFRKKS